MFDWRHGGVDIAENSANLEVAVYADSEFVRALGGDIPDSVQFIADLFGIYFGLQEGEPGGRLKIGSIYLDVNLDHSVPNSTGDCASWFLDSGEQTVYEAESAPTTILYYLSGQPDGCWAGSAKYHLGGVQGPPQVAAGESRSAYRPSFPSVWDLTYFSARAPSAVHSLRFFGNGTGDIDRVKISIDSPHRPVDVSGDFTLEFWMKALLLENSSSGCSEGNDNWIFG